VTGRDYHFAHLLAMELRPGGPVVTAGAPVRPESFVPGTSRIRTSVLLAMVDILAGHTPDGPGKPAVGATVDLRVVLLAPPPTTGRLHLRCEPLRVGRRFVVAETELSADGAAEPFARAVSTFAVLDLGVGAPAGAAPLVPVEGGSFDRFVGARVRDERTLLLDTAPRLANGPVGTLHGGVQAFVAELAAEHAVRGRERGLVATDVEMRYLDRVRVGPLTASARPVTSTAAPVVIVRLGDAGNGDRPVGHATVAFGPA
jgi:acyl-coenzyme A thioesterase PaaI-like protein